MEKLKLRRLFLVYWEGGSWGISLTSSKIFYNRNSANSYRFRMQRGIGDRGKYKIKVVYLWGLINNVY